MKSNASSVYGCDYLPWMPYSASCYKVTKHMSGCQFRGQCERQKETVLEKDKRNAFSGQPGEDSGERDCAGDGVDVENDDSAAVGSGVKKKKLQTFLCCLLK